VKLRVQPNSCSKTGITNPMVAGAEKVRASATKDSPMIR
jgi:hypothetical protein